MQSWSIVLYWIGTVSLAGNQMTCKSDQRRPEANTILKSLSFNICYSAYSELCT